MRVLIAEMKSRGSGRRLRWVDRGSGPYKTTLSVAGYDQPASSWLGGVLQQIVESDGVSVNELVFFQMYGAVPVASWSEPLPSTNREIMARVPLLAIGSSVAR